MTETQIGLLVFPRMTQLDMTGPFEVFARIPDAKVHLVWKRPEPVVSDVGLTLVPTTTCADCPPLDVICIPGGPGQIDLMEDPEIIDFVRRQGERARYVTSVCTGALVLGAAGLLRGYKAATHWASMDNLEHFGATPTKVRVCVDRNRITGGGVTAGIDFGLVVARELAGQEAAEKIQLYMEYDPAPPFRSGAPDTAPPAVVAAFRAMAAPMLARRKEVTARVAEQLKSSSARA
ncbi:MAG: thiamine biosynthesis protein ThiJ [Bradyrhizobiaceae bacterium]|nr:MAG: thiamine biosynthesis protein ThiJ [Bradyrhizobiaceae bacterium]